MSEFFHKLDKPTKQYFLYKRKGTAVVFLFVGALWAMEIAGLFNAMPYHAYFMPAFLFVAGVFELVRSYTLESKP